MFATSLPCNIGLGLAGRARRARRLDDYGMYANQETRNSGSLRECPQSVDEDSAALIRSAAWNSSLIPRRARSIRPSTESHLSRRDDSRSEERRVGKECRYRWWPYE